MARDGLVTLESTWRAERKGFRRMIIACILVSLGLSGYIGSQYWIFSIISTSIGMERDLEGLQVFLVRVQMMMIAVGILVVLSCLAFLTSMIRWLLSIRVRRRCLVEGEKLIRK